MSSSGRHAAPSHPRRRSAGRCRPVRSLTSLLLSLGALLLLSGAAAIVSLHLSAHVVLTGSMRGTFDPGALVLARPVPVQSIRPGDVIVFTPPGHSTPYTHRVRTVTGSPGAPVITTQGDANPAPDPWHARLAGPRVGRVVLALPGLGRVLLALGGRTVHTTLLALLGAVLAVAGTRSILGAPRPRQSSPHPL